jgi:hypothetical protein
MLARRDVRAGMYLVNIEQQAVREILAVDHESVSYNAYDLRTGKLLGAPQQLSPKRQVIRWADRAAREDETSLLQRGELAAVFEVEKAVPIELPALEAITAEVREEARRNNFAC